MNKVLSDLAASLDAKNAPYQLNSENEDIIRFRTRLPNHDAAPRIFLSYNEQSGMFILIMTELFRFNQGDLELFSLMNNFNSDNRNFACKVFIPKSGELTFACESFIECDDPLGQIHEYISLAIRGADEYYDRFLKCAEKPIA